MRRLLFAPLLALLGLVALAAPAVAKGPVENASGQVVITGPGLPGGSIELKGTIRGFQEPGDGFMPFESRTDGEFSALLFASAMLSGADSEQGWFVLQPENLRSIGPAYQLRLDMAGEGWSQTVTRQLYPFAPERPLIFTPAESITIAAPSRMQTLRGLWWSAPHTMLDILRSHGLPLTAPRVAEPPPATAPVPVAQPQGWVVLWTGLALLALVIAGVLAGRRRIRMA
ncbi:MAG: hypothetical protein ACRDHO_00170 [Actinomycetota bacterium]